MARALVPRRRAALRAGHGARDGRAAVRRRVPYVHRVGVEALVFRVARGIVEDAERRAGGGDRELARADAALAVLDVRLVHAEGHGLLLRDDVLEERPRLLDRLALDRLAHVDCELRLDR